MLQRNGRSVQRQVQNLQPYTVMAMGSWSTHVPILYTAVQSAALYCAARLLFRRNDWTLSPQRMLKICGQYCSDRLFSGQYSSSRVSQRYGTSPLDCLNHWHGTPQKLSTRQMKYRFETLTSKLSMKTLIK